MIEPLGSNRRIAVDVRVISATHCDLRQMVKDGKFREDLYYRLNVLEVKLPSLRERREDIPALAAAFLAQFGRDLGKPALSLSPDAVQALQGYAWPGNVRELRNLMERAAVLGADGAIGAGLIRSFVPAESAPVRTGLGLDPALDELERRMILDALVASDDNKHKAAELLGIGERTLWTKLKKHGI